MYSVIFEYCYFHCKAKPKKGGKSWILKKDQSLEILPLMEIKMTALPGDTVMLGTSQGHLWVTLTVGKIQASKGKINKISLPDLLDKSTKEFCNYLPWSCELYPPSPLTKYVDGGIALKKPSRTDSLSWSGHLLWFLVSQVSQNHWSGRHSLHLGTKSMNQFSHWINSLKQPWFHHKHAVYPKHEDIN